LNDSQREVALSQFVVSDGKDLFKNMPNMFTQSGSANLGPKDGARRENMLAQVDSQSVPLVNFAKLDDAFANANDFKFS